MSTYNIHHIAHNSKIYGPGDRDVIWFKGCTIRCKGCINPHLWSFDKENEMTLSSVLNLIKAKEVTLLGGEPLDQKDLHDLIIELKHRNIGVILFTGYSCNNLNAKKLQIVKLCDVVISEPFDLEKKDDSLYLRGSSNQIITFHTNRYNKSDFEEKTEYEIVISDELEFRGRKNLSFIDELLK